MYAYINGRIADKANNYVVIDCSGVGYRIFMSPNIIEKLPYSLILVLFLNSNK